MFRSLNNLIIFLNPLLDAMAHNAEVTRLDTMAYGVEVSFSSASQIVAPS